VALDATTGTLKWHFQTTHHDIYDYDLAAGPSLIEVTQNGRKIAAVVQATKMGLLFILDRVTGTPLFGVEERPVPKSDVPGEEAWATQPFPLKPPPLARNSMKRDEVAHLSPESDKFCHALREAAEASRIPVAKLGGKILGGWHAIGEVNFVAIIELPSDHEAATLAITFVAGASVCLIGFSGPLIHRWMGAAFDGSVAPFIALAVAGTIIVSQAAAGNVLLAAGSHRLLAGVWLAEAVVNLGLSVVLVRPLGLLGVAVGTLVPVALGHLLMIFPRACHAVALPVRTAWSETLRPALAGGACQAPLERGERHARASRSRLFHLSGDHKRQHQRAFDHGGREGSRHDPRQAGARGVKRSAVDASGVAGETALEETRLAARRPAG